MHTGSVRDRNSKVVCGSPRFPRLLFNLIQVPVSPAVKFMLFLPDVIRIISQSQRFRPAFAILFFSVSGSGRSESRQLITEDNVDQSWSQVRPSTC